MERKVCYFSSVISNKGNLNNNKVLETLIKLHFTRFINNGYHEFLIDLSCTGVANASLALQEARELFPYIHINYIPNFCMDSISSLGSNRCLILTDYKNFPKEIIRQAQENTINLVVLDCNNYNVFYY